MQNAPLPQLNLQSGGNRTPRTARLSPLPSSRRGSRFESQMTRPVDDRILAILKHFFTTAPPGQARAIAEACRNIVDELAPEVIEQLMELHNESVRQSIAIPGSPPTTARRRSIEGPASRTPEPEEPQMGLIGAVARIGPNRYLHPLSKRVFSVDHTYQTVVKCDPATDVKLPLEEPFRLAIEKAFNPYFENKYSGKTAAWGAYPLANQEDGSLQIAVVLSSHFLNLGNLMSGMWLANWRVTIPQGGSGAKLEGEISTVSHYSEDGNVMLRQKKEYSHPLSSGKNPDSAAKEVVEAIRRFEDELQASLDNACVVLARDTFRVFRRILPPSTQRFEWNASYETVKKEIANRTETMVPL